MMPINININIRLADSDALRALIAALNKCEDEQTKKEILDKLNALIEDVKGTIPDS